MKRPRIITTICVIGFISVLLTFPQVFSPSIKKLGLIVPAIFGVLVAMHFISCVGLWFFKQWGVQLYLISFFARLLFRIGFDLTGPFFFISLLTEPVFILILLKYYKRMNVNL